MIIPNESSAREQFFDELQRQCLASRADRFSFYQKLRNYYLFGTGDGSGAPYNKIGSTIETLASFLYSPDSTRFSIHLGVTADREDVFKAIPLAKEATDQWRISATHLRFALGLEWSMVFGTMLMKAQWDTRAKAIKTYLVEPHQFGVLREDVVDLSDQEAFCMCYSITRTQLESALQGHKNKNDILGRIGVSTAGGGELYSEGLKRLIIGGPVEGVSGSVASGQGGSSYVQGGGMDGDYSYAPNVAAEMVNMVDLYVYDDEIEDYQLISIAEPNVIIYDRPQSKVGIAKHPHFCVIRPQGKLYDYFWGSSFVAQLSWLQDWRTERINQLRGLMGRQFDPPMWGTGMAGISEEKFLGFRAKGSRMSMPTPGGSINVVMPEMPPDAFAELGQIDSMFDDVAGLGHILQGKGESGVRSKGQADLMARLGSSRPKSKAIIAEECAEDCATLILHNVQEHSDQRFIATLPDSKELVFVAKQFTIDYEVKVDAHSSSPIFIEDRKKDATELFEAKAIDRETLLDMFDPPNIQDLKERLKVIEAKEAEQAKMQMQMEAQKGAPHHK